ncbi:MAG: NAD(P)H-dependent oxidoreductase [Rhodospirillales bacterium]
MKVLIVHAHPEPKSFSSAMKDAAKATLELAGHEVTVSDLYAMNFKAVADADDFGTRRDPDYLNYALEQRANHEAGELALDIAGEIEKVLACDLLILNAPVFWFSVPAIMKGWIDRVFVSGAFYGGRRFYDRGGLTGKSALLTMTLGGREHMFGDDAVHGDLETMLRPLLRGTLHYVGMTVLKPFFAYHVPYISADERAAIMGDFCAYLGNIENAPVLSFPSLDDFDDNMHPKNPGH